MTRAPFQVLVLPYCFDGDGQLRFALLRRVDDEGGYWQGIAGGGHEGESPLDAAKREAAEEAGVPGRAHFLALDTVTSVPAEHFPASADWPPGTYVVPEHAFGVEVDPATIKLSDEHAEYAWLSFEAASARARFDSNRTALWELRERIIGGR